MENEFRKPVVPLCLSNGVGHTRMNVAQAAIGLRAHSGWAALIVLAGSPDSPQVVERRRIEMAGPSNPKQPYHAVQALKLEEAGPLLRRYRRSARTMAEKELKTVVKGLRARGYTPIGSGLVLASGRPLPALAGILASHAMIHTAE